MANYAAESVTSSGLTPTSRTASAADGIPVGAQIRINNANAGTVTVTATTPGTVDGDLAVADRVISIPTTQVRYARFGEAYRDPTDGLVHLAFSPFASVTFEVTL